MTGPLLRAAGLRRTYRTPGSLLSPASARTVAALDGVGLEVGAGERLGIVGESGSGKSTLVRTLLALERPDAGEVRYGSRPVRPGPARRLRWFRSQVQMVPQDPMSSLNPRLRVGESVAEPLVCLGVGGDHRERVAEVLAQVRLEPDAARRYPHEFSGGQRQRIAIARAIAPRPRLLVADEPVSALDVTVRAEVLALLRRLSEDAGLAVVLVSHDLGAVRLLCDRVLVMRAGAVVEQGRTGEILTAPRHDYTRGLLAAVPRLPEPEDARP
ncbi:ABC transporter ATP-binding protein [Allonocardiopsis opalescens]|uniref:Peptide/nickel transport system ATP-binding protein n=1 Tax=Allonocardiopsis opalescens TaxID=1144618 RepID=A0A2T0QEV0_9ACTN|nr:ABC transporter ATP-binding protein [Allonocardiopsis opalescens]PRY02432.1 peptide/nickel transport system ATP-binding protein [Allonocardiopsis opalescens]